VVKELGLVCVGTEVGHEVAHCLWLDVVIASNTSHVSCKDTFSLRIEPNQLHAVQLLNRLSHAIQQNQMPCWVVLKLIELDTVN